MNGTYGFAGLTNKSNNGVVDSEKEVYAFLEGMQEGEQLKQILSLFALKAGTPAVIKVTDITALTADQLEALRCGDHVIKVDSTGEHCYIVSFKGNTGRCLTYTDCENVETVAYEKTGDVWAYDSTDVTHIASN